MKYEVMISREGDFINACGQSLEVHSQTYVYILASYSNRPCDKLFLYTTVFMSVYRTVPRLQVFVLLTYL